MNKFLEKIAKFTATDYKVYKGALLGAGIGGASMGALTARQKTYKDSSGKDHELKGLRKAVYTGLNTISGSIIGAHLGSAIRPNQYHHYTGSESGFFRRYGHAHSNSYGRSSGGYSGGGGKQRQQKNTAYGRAGRGVKDIHKDLEFPTNGFKTKVEAKQHFRRMASKYHPDKHPNKADATAKMQKLNAVWEEYEKHPEGFTKLANSYLYKLAGLN